LTLEQVLDGFEKVVEKVPLDVALIKPKIVQKLVERLNQFERQLVSQYGFPNKQKINHKIKELKK
jgi:hypothetical protein